MDHSTENGDKVVDSWRIRKYERVLKGFFTYLHKI